MKMIWLWTPQDTGKPKCMDCMSGYSTGDLYCDVLAGITAGAVALPLGMAISISSGLRPEAGIYSALIAGVFVSLLGGSRIQIGGPSAAFIFFSASIVKEYGLPGLQMFTLMTGLALLFLTLTNLCDAVKRLPPSIVVGLANAIAILIVAKQAGLLLGLRTRDEPAEFPALLKNLAVHLSALNIWSCVLAAGSLILIFLAPRFTRRIPGSLIALAVAAGAAWALGLPVETIGTRFGEIPRGLPIFTLPVIRTAQIMPLVIPAFAAAILIALESLLTEAVTDTLSGDRHSSASKLIGQGVANALVPFVSGIPVSGTAARTAVNSRSGAITPIAGLIHVVTLGMLLVLAAPLAGYIPLAALAAMLVVLALNLSAWREIPSILRLELPARLSWMATVVLVLFAGFTVAVQAALALAALLYARRASLAGGETAQLRSGGIKGEGPLAMATILTSPYEVIERLPNPMGYRDANVARLAPIVILSVNGIDTTDLPVLEGFNDLLRGSGRILLLCGISSQSAVCKRHPLFVAHLGKRNILPSLPAAIYRASELRDRFFGIGERLAQELRRTPL